MTFEIEALRGVLRRSVRRELGVYRPLPAWGLESVSGACRGIPRGGVLTTETGEQMC